MHKPAKVRGKSQVVRGKEVPFYRLLRAHPDFTLQCQNCDRDNRQTHSLWFYVKAVLGSEPLPPPGEIRKGLSEGS